MGSITVADRIFDRQYHKTVLGSDGHASEVPRGALPDPDAKVIAREGEPAFCIRLARPVQSLADLPDDVVAALGRIGDRSLRLQHDGSEDENRPGIVECTLGPSVTGGEVLIVMDTDGVGAAPALVDAIVAIMLEELTPTGVDGEISVPAP